MVIKKSLKTLKLKKPLKKSRRQFAHDKTLSDILTIYKIIADISTLTKFSRTIENCKNLEDIPTLTILLNIFYQDKIHEDIWIVL